MQNAIAKFTAGVVVLGALSVSPASANGWEVWTEKQSADKVTVVASFGGDGSIEEAQLDLKVSGPFEVLEVSTLRKGSICFGNAEKNVLRAVPPSGAGSALKAAMTDTCMFTLRVLSPKGWSAEGIVDVGFKECASSVKGVVGCEAKFQVVE